MASKWTLIDKTSLDDLQTKVDDLASQSIYSTSLQNLGSGCIEQNDYRRTIAPITPIALQCRIGGSYVQFYKEPYTAYIKQRHINVFLPQTTSRYLPLTQPDGQQFYNANLSDYWHSSGRAALGWVEYDDQTSSIYGRVFTGQDFAVNDKYEDRKLSTYIYDYKPKYQVNGWVETGLTSEAVALEWFLLKNTQTGILDASLFLLCDGWKINKILDGNKFQTWLNDYMPFADTSGYIIVRYWDLMLDVNRETSATIDQVIVQPGQPNIGYKDATIYRQEPWEIDYRSWSFKQPVVEIGNTQLYCHHYLSVCNNEAVPVDWHNVPTLSNTGLPVLSSWNCVIADIVHMSCYLVSPIDVGLSGGAAVQLNSLIDKLRELSAWDDRTMDVKIVMYNNSTNPVEGWNNVYQLDQRYFNRDVKFQAWENTVETIHWNIISSALSPA